MKWLASLALAGCAASVRGQGSVAQNGARITWEEPSREGTVNLTINFPVEFGWIGFGLGERMEGSAVFLCGYRDFEGLDPSSACGETSLGNQVAPKAEDLFQGESFFEAFTVTRASGTRTIELINARGIAGKGFNFADKDNFVVAWAEQKSEGKHTTKFVMPPIVWNDVDTSFDNQRKFAVGFGENGGTLSWITSSNDDALLIEIVQPAPADGSNGWIGFALTKEGLMNSSAALVANIGEVVEATLIKPNQAAQIGDDQALATGCEGDSTVKDASFSTFDKNGREWLKFSFKASSICGEPLNIFGRNNIIVNFGKVDELAGINRHLKENPNSFVVTWNPVVVETYENDGNFNFRWSYSFPVDDQVFVEGASPVLPNDNGPRSGFIGFAINDGAVIGGTSFPLGHFSFDNNFRNVVQQTGKLADLLYQNFQVDDNFMRLEFSTKILGSQVFDFEDGNNYPFQVAYSSRFGAPSSNSDITFFTETYDPFVFNQVVSSQEIQVDAGDVTRTFKVEVLGTSQVRMSFSGSSDIDGKWFGFGVNDEDIMAGTSAIYKEANSDVLSEVFLPSQIQSEFVKMREERNLESDFYISPSTAQIEQVQNEIVLTTRSFAEKGINFYRTQYFHFVYGDGGNFDRHQSSAVSTIEYGTLVEFPPTPGPTTRSPTGSPTKAPTRPPRIQEFKTAVFSDNQGLLTWTLLDDNVQITIERDLSPNAPTNANIGVGISLSDGERIVIGDSNGTIFEGKVTGTTFDGDNSNDSDVTDAEVEYSDGVIKLSFICSKIAGESIFREGMQRIVTTYSGSDGTEIANKDFAEIQWNPVIQKNIYFQDTPEEVTLYRSFPREEYLFLQVEANLNNGSYGWVGIGAAGENGLMVGGQVLLGEVDGGSSSLRYINLESREPSDFEDIQVEDDPVLHKFFTTEFQTMKLEMVGNGFGTTVFDFSPGARSNLILATSQNGSFPKHTRKQSFQVEFAEEIFSKVYNLGDRGSVGLTTYATSEALFEIEYKEDVGYFGFGISGPNGAMIGSNVVIHSFPTGGDTFVQYELIGKNLQEGVFSDANDNFFAFGPPERSMENGVFRSSFTTNQFNGKGINFHGSNDLVFAHGNLNDQGLFVQHTPANRGVIQRVRFQQEEGAIFPEPPVEDFVTLKVLDNKGEIRFNSNPLVGTVDLEFSYEASSGWLSIGISDEGRMDRSSALVGFDLQSGGVVEEKIIDATSRAGIKDFTGRSTLLDVSFSQENGKLILKATLQSISGRNLKFDNTKESVVFAYGTSNLLDTQHTERNSVDINWIDGAFDRNDDNKKDLIFIHSVLMIAGMLFIMPIAAVPSVFRESLGLHNGQPATWFKIHRAMQLSACLMVIVSFFLAFSTQENHFNTTHKALGAFIIVLCFAQPFLAIFFRHNPATRSKWLASHLLFAGIITIGSIVAALLGVNEASGILDADTISNLQTSVYIGAVVVAIVAVSVQFKRVGGFGSSGVPDQKPAAASKVVRWDHEGANQGTRPLSNNSNSAISSYHRPDSGSNSQYSRGSNAAGGSSDDRPQFGGRSQGSGRDTGDRPQFGGRSQGSGRDIGNRPQFGSRSQGSGRDNGSRPRHRQVARGGVFDVETVSQNPDLPC